MEFDLTETFDPQDILYTSDDIARIGTAYLKDRRENKDCGIAFGIPEVDKILLPLLPTDLVFVIGRPGNGKTGAMVWWARSRAKKLEAAKVTDKIVLYLTLEQSIEELYAFNMAADEHISVTKMARGIIDDAEWKRILTASMRRKSLPLWYIGHSGERRRKRPVMSLENVGATIRRMEDEHHKRVDILFVDYLQRLPYNGRESKTVGISENVDKVKDLALTVGCPVVVGVQACREVDDRNPPIPQMEDGQWTSNIEQAGDKILSVVRPRKYRKEGEDFGSTTVKGNCQMLISILKQKMGPANECKWVRFDPEYNILDDLEMRNDVLMREPNAQAPARVQPHKQNPADLELRGDEDEDI
jgi:replicative DNA helicase